MVHVCLSLHLCSSDEADPGGTQVTEAWPVRILHPLRHIVGSGTQVSLMSTSSKILTGTIGKEALFLPGVANLVE